MSHLQRPVGAAGQRLAGILAELAIPAPFTMEGLRGSLEGYLERPIHLVPVAMGPDAPSGVFIQTAGADYLYYEQRTSPFHQMHIVTSLTARALVSDPGRPSIDPRLVPNVGPHLVVPMLGDVSPGRLDDRDADAFAVQVVSRAGMSACSAPVAWRLLRRLRPLHQALTRAVPQAARSQSSGHVVATRVRLHLRVAEIRDAMLALRPWRDVRVAWAAAKATRAAGLIGGAEFAASVEAAILAHALRAWQSGQAALPGETCGLGQPFGLGPDLYSEALWLERVSREFSRHPLGDAFWGNRPSDSSTVDTSVGSHDSLEMGPLHSSRDCDEPSASREARGSVKRLDCRLDGHGTPMEARTLRRRFVRRACSEW